MPVLNHHIVAARRRDETALFFSEVLGLPPPVQLGEFAVVQVSPDTTLDFVESGGEIHQQHYAFLVTETEFDEIFTRLKDRDLDYWADPFRKQRGETNDWDDGRG